MKTNNVLKLLNYLVFGVGICSFIAVMYLFYSSKNVISPIASSDDVNVEYTLKK